MVPRIPWEGRHRGRRYICVGEWQETERWQILTDSKGNMGKLDTAAPTHASKKTVLVKQKITHRKEGPSDLAPMRRCGTAESVNLRLEGS